MHPLVYQIREALRGYYPESEAASLAKLLLAEVFGFSTIELYGGKDKGFSEKEQKLLTDIIARLRKNEPIQYIIGRESFCGLTFEVNPHVLIPRPETQELVAWIVEDYRLEKECRVLDIGTGSGCIPVALAHSLEGAEVEAWDISEEALQVARRNAERNHVRVNFRRQDVFEAVPGESRYDVFRPILQNRKRKTWRQMFSIGSLPSLCLFLIQSRYAIIRPLLRWALKC